MSVLTGIVLKTTAYQEDARILHVFSLQLGLCTFFVKGLSQKKSHLLSLTEPFSEIEVHYRKGKTEMLYPQDIHGIHAHLSLRARLSSLKAAGLMTEAILYSQLPGKEALPLYLLLQCYLKQIPEFENPLTLVASFYLKLLRHEGLLALSTSCSLCSRQASSLKEGESFCEFHTSQNESVFSEKEWVLLHTLAFASHFEPLKALEISEKIYQWTEDYLRKELRKS